MYSGTLPANYVINPNVVSLIERMKIALHKYTVQQNIASDTASYYTVIYNVYFIIITVLSGIVTILSFLNSSNIFNETTIKAVNITCGVIGITITILHNISNGYKYQSKMETYKTISNNYSHIISDIKHHDIEKGDVLNDHEIKSDMLHKTLANNISIPRYITNRYM